MAIEDAHWLMYDPGEIIPGPVWEYFIKGDTVINDKIYKKIYQRNFFQDSSYSTPYPYIVEEEALFAAIRDDTVQKKVYIFRFPPTIWDHSDLGFGVYDCLLMEEFLLYDFSFEVGDTLSELCLFFGGTDYIPIDSIYLKEHFGYFLKTFYGESAFGYGEIEFVERIGFIISGIFNANFMYNSHRFLKKFCIGDDCDYLLGIKEPIELSNVS